MGVYAPFLASSKPLVVYFEGHWYFPLFRYLFYNGFFTKRLDIFYNLLIFTLPIFLFFWLILKPFWRRVALLSTVIGHVILFAYFALRTPQDPATDAQANQIKQRQLLTYLQAEKQSPLTTPFLLPNWQSDVEQMTPYTRLNLVLRYQQQKRQMERFAPYVQAYSQEREKKGRSNTFLPILWNLEKENEAQEIERLEQSLLQNKATYLQAQAWLTAISFYCKQSHLPAWLACDFLNYLPPAEMDLMLKEHQIASTYAMAQARLQYIKQRHMWLEQQEKELKYEIMPLLRPFHWEDDAGGSQELNRYISWWDLTRINRKDMVAALIFGVRISISVGLTAVGLALLIGIPIGALAGYYGGKVDMITYRLIEIWESMPTFFMLLMVVAFLQNKSIFIVISVIGLFGWTTFSRYIRGEFFKQKQLPYVEACRALGFSDRYIMFSHLLPNAIPPLLTLVPFAVMGAITSEAGLSFLGLGEEGSCSWGVLMDEGRSAFPAESYLLWPPAILLTIFLVAIALVGDALRDALDPKLHRALQ
jgi:peptide/nickel transport system permease protein